MRTIRTLPALTALALAAMVGACATGSSTDGVYQWDVGPATAPMVEREVQPILSANGFQILRTERYGDRIRIETTWQRRQPHPAEADAGVVDARARIFVTTRSRGVTNSSGVPISGVTLRMEVEHMFAGENQWVGAREEAPETVALGRQIAEAIKLELQVKGMQSG
jgi:hypothetical protein